MGKMGLAAHERRKMKNREGAWGRLDKKTSVVGNGAMQRRKDWGTREKGGGRDEEARTGMRGW